MDGSALSNYGYMLANGWGVERNVTAAREHFASAIEQGDMGGYVGMGYLHYYGMGEVEQNFTMVKNPTL
jgi:TPR repeat protein